MPTIREGALLAASGAIIFNLLEIPDTTMISTVLPYFCRASLVSVLIYLILIGSVMPVVQRDQGWALCSALYLEGGSRGVRITKQPQYLRHFTCEWV